jgi:hypothetical protein
MWRTGAACFTKRAHFFSKVGDVIGPPFDGIDGTIDSVKAMTIPVRFRTPMQFLALVLIVTVRVEFDGIMDFYIHFLVLIPNLKRK